MKANLDNLTRTLWEMEHRTKVLHSLGNSRSDSAMLNQFFQGALTGDDGKPLTRDAMDKIRTEMCAEIRAAWADPEKMRELCGLRIQTESNYMRASSAYAENFFSVITLGDGDRPAFQNETRQEIDIGYVSQDGKTRLNKAVAPQDEYLIPLRPLSSDVVGYFTRDIYNGNITTAATRTVDIGFDLRRQYDKNAFTLLTAARGSGGALGTFDFGASGTKRNLRDAALHSGIVAANLPTTNDIVVAGNTAASGKFRLAVLRAIVQYAVAWGAGTFSDGDLFPTGMVFIPSIETAALTNEITPNGSTNNPIANELMQKYLNFSYMGINWVLVPDATIPAGKCYPVFNKPVGYIYRKPSMDKELVKTYEEKDWEERSAKIITGIYIPSNRRMNFARFDYLTAS